MEDQEKKRKKKEVKVGGELRVVEQFDYLREKYKMWCTMNGGYGCSFGFC